MAPRLHTETREALILQVLRLPSETAAGHSHERSPLAASLSMGRVAARQTMEKRPQPTEEPAESLQGLLSLRRVASTIAEGKQLTPSRNKVTI